MEMGIGQIQRAFWTLLLFAAVGINGCNSIEEQTFVVAPQGGAGGGAISPTGPVGSSVEVITSVGLLARAFPTSVFLLWSPPGNVHPYAYTLERRTASGAFAAVATGLSATQFTDFSFSTSESYFYRLRARSANNVETVSSEVPVSPIGNFSIRYLNQSASGFEVVWDNVLNATRYEVRYGIGAGGAITNVLSTNAVSPMSAPALTQGSTYRFQVRAKNSVGSGAEADSAILSTGPLVPPFSFTIGQISTGIEVRIPAVPGADRYDIEWGTASGQYTQSSTVDANANPTFRATIGPITAGQTYFVQVHARIGFMRRKSNAEQSLAAVNFSQAEWNFDSGTESDYSSSSSFLSIELSGGVCRLKGISASGFLTSSGKGVLWNAGTSSARLGLSGSCDASSTNCNQLNAEWTPRFQNIVRHFSFDGIGSPSHGSIVSAQVGSHGVVSNANGLGMQYVPGRIGNALYFDGVDDYVEVATIQPGSSFTISMWLRINASPGWAPVFEMGTSPRFMFWHYNNFLGALGYSDGPFTSTSDVLLPNHWVYVVYTFDSGASPQNRVFINGDEVSVNNASTVSSIPIIGEVMRIGASTHAGHATYFFQGAIDELSIWNISLTENEARILYEFQGRRFGGRLVSRVFDSGVPTSWDGLAWKTKVPAGKPLSATAETSASYPQTLGTVANGLVGYWNMNETSGTTLQDASGSGNHARVLLSPKTSIHGKFGSGFDTRSNWAYVPENSSLNLTSAWSIQAWVKILGDQVGYPTILTEYYDPSPNALQYCLGYCGHPTFGAGFYQSGWNWNMAYMSGQPPKFVWHHLVGTYQGSSGRIRFYLNGVQISEFLGAAPTSLRSGGGVHIGRRWDSDELFQGVIDELGLWNRELSASEVTELYRRGADQVGFQYRLCSAANAGLSDCTDGSSWRGPDGTAQTLFTELNNNSIPLTGNGNTLATSPQVAFSSFGPTPTPARYVQFRTIVASDHVASSPELTEFRFTGPTFDTSAPRVHGTTGMPFAQLTRLEETLGSGGCSAGVGYTLSLDQTVWYWWNGTGWAVSNGTAAQSAGVTTTNSGLATFHSQVGSGTVYVRAHLKSSGTSACEIDQIRLIGTF